MIVPDASAIVAWLLGGNGAEVVRRHLLMPKEEFSAPHLLDVEVAQVFRRQVISGALNVLRAEVALDDLRELPVHRYEHDVFLPRIWALRHNMTAYDAAYVALAEALRATLLTGDRRLASVAQQHVRVTVV